MAPIITWATTLLATNLVYSFSSDKMIHIVEYGYNQYESYIGGKPSTQKYTVEKFAQRVDALVAINGGYHGFNSPEQKGPITKLQIDGQLIVPNNNLTVLAENGLSSEHVDSVLSIDASHHQVSIGSIEDVSYIYSGPLLLQNSIPTNISSKWDNVRNPRTIVCTKPNKILYIVVDGRQKDVPGMTLKEVQSLLLDIQCENAINMDGGGSTTMYIKGYGIVNTPRSSDGKGNYTTVARSVSSILYIK